MVAHPAGKSTIWCLVWGAIFLGRLALYLSPNGFLTQEPRLHKNLAKSLGSVSANTTRQLSCQIGQIRRTSTLVYPKGNHTSALDDVALEIRRSPLGIVGRKLRSPDSRARRVVLKPTFVQSELGWRRNDSRLSIVLAEQRDIGGRIETNMLPKQGTLLHRLNWCGLNLKLNLPIFGTSGSTDPVNATIEGLRQLL